MPHSPWDVALWWMVLSLINAGLAQGRERSGLNWFLVSLLLGPLATVLIVTRGGRPSARTGPDEL